MVGPSVAAFSSCVAGSTGCIGTGTSDDTTSASATTTSVATVSVTTTTTNVATSTVSSTAASTTRTSSNTQCADLPLPVAWSGGGVHTCLTYEQRGLAYCDHAELQVACCFCGGGGSEPMPSSTPVPMPTTTTTTATPSPCTDAPLPVAWSGGGTHTCSTYEQHGGSAYCAHKELAEACCFCRASLRFSALSSQTEPLQPSGQISRASIFTPNLVAIASLFVGVMCRLHV